MTNQQTVMAQGHPVVLWVLNHSLIILLYHVGVKQPLGLFLLCHQESFDRIVSGNTIVLERARP